MLPALRPDTGSYNRLFVSLGLLAIAAGFLIPWLLLRETSVLEISRTDLANMTPDARAAVMDRQGDLARLQDWWWVAPVALIPLGIMLVVLGAKGLRSQQHLEDRRLAADVRIGERQATVEPQSEEERQAKLRDDVALVEPVAAEDTAAGTEQAHVRPQPEPVSPELPSKTAHLEPPARTRWSLTQLKELEDAVLTRVGDILPSEYRFEPHPKVSGGGRILFIDGLIRRPEHPDVIVEVRIVRSPRPTTRILDQAIASAIRYRRLVGQVGAWTWLIVFVAEPGSDDMERFRSTISRNEVPDLVRSNVVTDVAEIAELPPDPEPLFDPATMAAWEKNWRGRLGDRRST